VHYTWIEWLWMAMSLVEDTNEWTIDREPYQRVQEHVDSSNQKCHDWPICSKSFRYSQQCLGRSVGDRVRRPRVLDRPGPNSTVATNQSMMESHDIVLAT
jgi:hypothetical protein